MFDEHGTLHKELRRLGEIDFQAQDIQFTHDIILKEIEIAADSQHLLAGPPRLYLPAPVPLRRNIMLEGSFIIGQAGMVEGHLDSFRLGFQMLGNHPPMYGPINAEFTLLGKG
jgi:hypothetical protein